MLDVLERCAARFREYEQSHAAKADEAHRSAVAADHVAALDFMAQARERDSKATRNREMAEFCEKAIEEFWPPMLMLRRLVRGLDELIAESGGVYGIGSHGTQTPWDDLLEGGTFDGWLKELDEARRMVDGEQGRGRHRLEPLLRYLKSGEPDLNNRQTAILMTVAWTPGPHTVRGLAATLHVAKPVVSRGLMSLAELGFLVRSKNPDDQRDCIPLITPKGKAFLERVYG